ncbi:MAG: SCO family protein [Balneolaceae bacterium]
MKIPVSVYLLLLGAFLAVGCSSTIDDYNDVSYSLVDQNGDSVQFPADFKGAPVVMGFIYTNCPDICSFITANIHKIWQEMGRPEDIHLVLVTFDPERDTPEALKEYAGAFSMDRPPFTFLTGTEEEVEAMMQRTGVRTQVSYTMETDAGEELYFLNHTDKILLIDRDSRLIMDYGGSMTPPDIIIEDLQSL